MFVNFSILNTFYILVKSFLRNIIPFSLLFRIEPILRTIFYQFYKGNNYKCNICDKKNREFIDIRGDKVCPKCGSSQRDRRLYSLIEALIKDDLKILDFSPSRSLYRKLKNIPHIDYLATDLSNDFISDISYDIKNIKTENKFNLIICYHILEHIDDDLRAMSELYSVLEFGGKCIIQTPFKLGDIYEDTSITSDEDKLRHFGQKDHLRIYSIDGLVERLEDCGFNVELNEFVENENNYYGYKKSEHVLICNKS